MTQELTELTGFVEDMQALGRQPTGTNTKNRFLVNHYPTSTNAIACISSLAAETIRLKSRNTQL
jgi:hypothetical protein